MSFKHLANYMKVVYLVSKHVGLFCRRLFIDCFDRFMLEWCCSQTRYGL